MPQLCEPRTELTQSVQQILRDRVNQRGGDPQLKGTVADERLMQRVALMSTAVQGLATELMRERREKIDLRAENMRLKEKVVYLTS